MGKASNAKKARRSRQEHESKANPGAEAEGLREGCRSVFREMVAAFTDAPSPSAIYMPVLTVAGLAEAEAVAVMFGWTNRVMRTGESALLLDEAGYACEGGPLVRSMIEHAIALWWVRDTPSNAFQSLVRGRQDQVRALKKAPSIGWQVSAEILALMEEALNIETDQASRAADTFLHTKHQAEKYGLGNLYQAWLVETWASHASLASASPYYNASGANDLALTREPRAEGRSTAAAVVIAAHTALSAYDGVLPNEPLADSLHAWESALGDLLEEHK